MERNVLHEGAEKRGAKGRPPPPLRDLFQADEFAGQGGRDEDMASPPAHVALGLDAPPFDMAGITRVRRADLRIVAARGGTIEAGRGGHGGGFVGAVVLEVPAEVIERPLLRHGRARGGARGVSPEGAMPGPTTA